MNSAELQRILQDDDSGQRFTETLTDRIIAECPGNADEVLARCKEVLVAILSHGGSPWPSDTGWRELLPSWFIERCAADQTPEEAQAELESWRRLDPDEQADLEAQRQWSVRQLMYWFRPENRSWHWGKACVLDPDTIAVDVEIDAWPYGAGDLIWLLRASGATCADKEI